MLISKCGDCGKSIVEKQKQCTCGWMVLAKTNVQLCRYRCQQQEDGEQCDRAGTVSRKTRGGNDIWLCFPHWYLANN